LRAAATRRLKFSCRCTTMSGSSATDRKLRSTGAITVASPSAIGLPSGRATEVARRTSRPSPLAVTRTETMTSSPTCTRPTNDSDCEQ
jgi:hypothetical protein